MNENAYSNREIDSKITSFHDKLDQVLAQTTKTNGRVNTLEMNVNELANWKSFTKGALAILTILVVPILIFLIQSYLLK